MLTELTRNPELEPELQDVLYDQLRRYTQLMADVQMAGLEQSTNTHRMAIVYGKKTATSLHRGRNRGGIAENMQQLEAEHTK